jgi:hypothetical protein
MSNNLTFNNCSIETINNSISNIQTKWCSKCKAFKSLEESFYKNKSSKDGYQAYCKECKRNANKICDDKNKEKRNAHLKEYYKANKDKVLERCKNYNEKNKDKILEYQKIYRVNNKDKISEYSKIYKEQNKDLINTKRREKYANDICFKVQNNLRSGLHQALSKQNATKRNNTLKLTGLSIEELTDWLQFTEKFYIPKNYQGTIEVEHMMPFAKVDLTTLEGQEHVMNWKNLRHYTYEENHSKAARLPTPLEKLKQLLICYLFKVTVLDQKEVLLNSDS